MQDILNKNEHMSIK